MNIRKASVAEFPSVWTGQRYFGKQFLEYLETGVSELWIAEDQGKIIGKLYFFKELKDKDFADGQRRAYITNFFVLPDYRGQGIGTKLLENTFKRLNEIGFLEATIGVDETEINNVRLYNKMGFTAVVKNCAVDPICVDETGRPMNMQEFALLLKPL